LKQYTKTIIASFLIILACLGLGRFSFGMVLPNIQESLALTTTQVGFIGTANFIGYLAGIFFANILYNKYETYKLIFITILLQSLSMFIMILFNSYLYISLVYSFSGFFSAIANISIMAYVANVVPKEFRGKALGLAVSGSGLAIIFSGELVPYIESLTSNMPWKYSWMIFSLILLIVAFISKGIIKKHAKHDMPESKVSVLKYIKTSAFWKIATIYMVFGISYSIFVTYFVSAVMDKYSLSSDISGDFWAILGFSSLFSGLIFGIIADKYGAYKSLFFVYTLQTIAHFILSIDVNSIALFISAIAFGISVWSIPSLVTLLTSQHFDVRRTAKVLSLLTILFASLQAIGPVAAGYTYDITNDFSEVFLLTSVLTLFAALISFIFSKQTIKQIH